MWFSKRRPNLQINAADRYKSHQIDVCALAGQVSSARAVFVASYERFAILSNRICRITEPHCVSESPASAG